MAEEITDHSGTARGRAFLWGGTALGVLLVLVLLTRGFGLLGGRGAAAETPFLTHRDGRLFVPEGSALRSRLTIAPAAERSVSGTLQLPAVVEADPARSAALLAPLAGRVQELKVRLGERVKAGQVLAVIDSPDLAQAYDDNSKAADTFTLTRRNLERQEGQARIGAVSERELDQARSDQAQASAEYTRTQARLRALGIAAEPKSRTRFLVLRAPLRRQHHRAERRHRQHDQ